jgi:hypothetical protein
MADKDFRVKLGIEVGANAAIQGSITTVDSIQLDLSAGIDELQIGQIAWSVDDNTASIGLGSINLQLGQEELYYIKNQSGETIGKGNVVMFAGTIGSSGILLGRKAIANGTVLSKYVMGIASQSISDGDDGYVTSFGKLRQLDTSMFAEGDILYVDAATPGALSNVAPVAPNNKVTVAAVVTSSINNGELFVRATFSDAVSGLEDVYIDSISDGQTIVWNSANARFEAGTAGGGGGGFTGSVGFTGSQGDTGFTGSQGSIGFTGSQGDIGFTGSQGDIGFTGSQGDIGFTGSQGDSAQLEWSIKTANYTATSGEGIIANTSAGSFIITLPATPVLGSYVTIADGADWSINNLTVARNGSTIEGSAADFILDVQQVSVDFVYDGSTWQVYTNIGPTGLTGFTGSSGVTTRSTTAGATSGTLTINGDTTDIFVAEGLTDAITFAQPSGTPINGQKLLIRIADDGTSRSSTWTTTAGAFRAIGLTLITTTVSSKTSYVGCVYNSTDSFWDVIATATQA